MLASPPAFLAEDVSISFANFSELISNFSKRPTLADESAVTQNNTYNLNNVMEGEEGLRQDTTPGPLSCQKKTHLRRHLQSRPNYETLGCI